MLFRSVALVVAEGPAVFLEVLDGQGKAFTLDLATGKVTAKVTAG